MSRATIAATIILAVLAAGTTEPSAEGEKKAPTLEEQIQALDGLNEETLRTTAAEGLRRIDRLESDLRGAHVQVSQLLRKVEYLTHRRAEGRDLARAAPRRGPVVLRPRYPTSRLTEREGRLWRERQGVATKAARRQSPDVLRTRFRMRPEDLRIGMTMAEGDRVGDLFGARRRLVIESADEFTGATIYEWKVDTLDSPGGAMTIYQATLEDGKIVSLSRSTQSEWVWPRKF